MQEKNGTIYETILHIPTADTGELFLYDITPIEIKEVEQSGNSDTSLNLSGRQSGNSDTSPSNNKIVQSEQEVKEQYSLRDVDPVEPSSDAWNRSATFAEVKAKHPISRKRENIVVFSHISNAENDFKSSRRDTEILSFFHILILSFSFINPDFPRFDS